MLNRQERQERREQRREDRQEQRDERQEQRDERHGPVQIARAAKNHLGSTKAKAFMKHATTTGVSIAVMAVVRTIADAIKADPESLDPGVLDKVYKNSTYKGFCDSLKAAGFGCAGIGGTQMLTAVAGGNLTAPFIGSDLKAKDYKPAFPAGLAVGTFGIGLTTTFGVALSGWLSSKGSLARKVYTATMQAASLNGASITVVMSGDDLDLLGMIMSYDTGMGASAVTGWGRLEVR